MDGQIITITDAAAERVKALMEKAEGPVLGLRVGVNTRGCNGLSYTMDYTDQKKPGEEEIDTKGVRIFIDPASFIYLFGSEMDYVEDKLASRFVFNNPNAKSLCGCGESFNV